MNSYKTTNEVINTVLEVAAPFLAELVTRYEAREIAAGNRFNARDKEFYELAVTGDLINAIGNYIIEGDTISMIDVTTSKGVIAISARITRNGEPNYFGTQMIGAGGYNVQCYHYRYIVDTKLPRKQNPFAEALKATVKKMKAEDRIKETIAGLNNWLERTEKDLAEHEAKTEADAESEYNQFWLTRYGTGPKFEYLNEQAKQRYGTPEAYDRKNAEGVAKTFQGYKNRISANKQTIKKIKKDIDKQNAKLEALNK